MDSSFFCPPADTLSSNILLGIGNCPNSFAFCPNPYCNRLGSISSKHSKFSWALVVSCDCTTPETIWYVCTTCVNQRVQLINNKQLSRHSTNHHQQTRKRPMTDIENNNEMIPLLHNPPCFETMFSDDNLFSEEMSHCNNVLSDDNHLADGDIFMDPLQSHVHRTLVDDGINRSSNTAPLTFNYLDASTSQFFQYENNGGYGLSYLSALSITNNDQFTYNMHPDDVSLYFNIARLCFNITRTSRSILCLILAQLDTKLYSDSTQQKIPIIDNQICNLSKLPCTLSTLRVQFIEGKYAFIPNIPIPKYESIGQCLYASIRSCLAYMLALGIPILNLSNQTIAANNSNNYNISHLHQSLKVKKLVSESALTGCESYDIITYITEWSDAFDPNTSTKNNRGSVYVKTITFPRPPDSLFPVSFYTFPICIGPSKVERYKVEKMFCSELELFKGSTPLQFYDGTTGSMKTVFLDILCALQDQPERRTSLCLMMGNSRFSPRWGFSFDYKFVKKHVVSCSNCFEILLDKKVPDSDCKDCVDWNICSTNSQLLQFKPPKNYPNDSKLFTTEQMLHPVKLNTKFLIEVVRTSVEKLKLALWTDVEAKTYMSVYGINNVLSTNVINEAKLALQDQPRSSAVDNDPQLHDQTCNITHIPHTWLRRTDVDDHIETIMHLLFLGIVKTFLMDIHIWLKKRSMFSLFLSEIDNYLLSIETLKLTWCRIICYGTGKFGGHVSENYLAMARVLKWFVCILNIYNCASRDCEFEHIVNVASSLYAMLSRLLQRVVCPELCDSAERHVKIFLNYYVLLDKKLKGEDNDGWIKKYNFLSLLNLPEQMRSFGPLLNLWEGGYMGERIITTMKPEIVSGLRMNWTSSLYKKVMRKYFFDVLTVKKQHKELIGYSSPIDENTRQTKKRYSSITELQYNINLSLPIVAEHLSNGLLVVCFDNGTVYKGSSIGDATFVLDCYFHFIEWELYNEPVTEQTTECLLLPFKNFLGRENVSSEERTRYYIVTSEWKEYYHDFVPKLASLSKCTYTHNMY
jgi:hypothetical protein